MPLTRGFAPKELGRQFKKHGQEFKAATAVDYQALADAFLGGPLSSPCLQCKRKDGDVVRYNPVSNEFGILSQTRQIITFFKPNHGTAADRLAYYNRTCQK